jgi:hypothetical protein
MVPGRAFSAGLWLKHLKSSLKGMHVSVVSLGYGTPLKMPTKSDTVPQSQLLGTHAETMFQTEKLWSEIFLNN